MLQRSTGWASVAVAALAGGLTVVAAAAAGDTGDELYGGGHDERALARWKQVAAKGDAHAAYRLGVVHADGAMVKQGFIGTRFGSLADCARKMNALEIKRGLDLALGFEPIE